MDEMALELKQIFLTGNKKLLNDDLELFLSQVSERTLCGALKQHLDFLYKKRSIKNIMSIFNIIETEMVKLKLAVL